MRNKVAIIGSDSFLSRYVIENLSPDHTIVGYSRNNHNQLAAHIPFDFPNQHIDFDKLLEFDSIVYCAGSGIQAGRGEDFVYELNTYLPLNLALFLDKHQYEGKYITFGSYAEIGNNKEEKAFNESEVLSSVLSVPNNYCVSKRLLSRFFDSANLKINFYHLILPTIYGLGENPNRLLPYLIKSLTAKQKPKLTGGYQTRQYIHAKDVAVLLRNILYAEALEKGIFNVPSYETRLVKDIISSIYTALDADESLTPDSLQRYDESMRYLELNATKIRSQFPDWQPAISILDSIEEYLN